MSWAEEGFDPANLQAGLVPGWKFFNAFFRAFQERGGYIEGAGKFDDYEDLFLTGPQIGASELMRRLGKFNGFVNSSFSATKGTDWYKQSTWDQIVEFEAERINLTSRQKSVRGLTVIDLEVWDEEALKELLDDVPPGNPDESENPVYDMIFDSGSDQKFFDTRYWGGLYKLLNQVMLHRELTMKFAFDPDPTEPHLVINGGERFAGNDENLSVIMAKSITATDKFNGGFQDLRSSGVSASTTFRLFEDDGDDKAEPMLTSNAGITYRGNRDEPFCKSPTQMDIQLLLWVGQGFSDNTVEGSGVTGESNSVSVSAILSPFASSLTEEVIDGERQDDVFLPSQELAFSNVAQNPHFPLMFDEDTGETTVSLASIRDLRVDNDVTQEPSETGQPDGRLKPFSSVRGHSQGNENFLNLAFCSLPQDDFEFPAE